MTLSFKSSPLPFERMNEADVREEILTPLIAALGYRTGTEFDVIREQTLRYPKLSLGRKNPKRDPILRGKADYILEVSNHARWVLEAKSPSQDIDVDSLEQSWSYANHPEIRAAYFAVSNGRELRVYATASPPDSEPILRISYEELAVRFRDLETILAPWAIVRAFPDRRLPSGPPLGPGLRSFARVLSGLIIHHSSSISQPFLDQMQVAIVDGSIERNEDGLLLAYMKTQSPLRTMQTLNETMGLDTFEMTSQASVLSTDPDLPTKFIYSREILVPAGTELLDTTTWKTQSMPVDLHCEVAAEAIGYLSQNIFSGRFGTAMCVVNAPVPPVTVSGEFHLRLA